VEHISDRVAVMYLGNIVEAGEGGELYPIRCTPYSEAQLSQIPRTDPDQVSNLLILRRRPHPGESAAGRSSSPQRYAQELCGPTPPRRWSCVTITGRPPPGRGIDLVGVDYLEPGPAPRERRQQAGEGKFTTEDARAEFFEVHSVHGALCGEKVQLCVSPSKITIMARYASFSWKDRMFESLEQLGIIYISCPYH
jgi:ABC-type glutathione transport system ATPase component